MSSPEPDVVVVVPSIRIDDLLVRCVETCRRLSPQVPIVVVVDDDEGAGRLDGAATVLRSVVPSIAAKRNLAVARSDSRHVAFIDSDAYPAPGWLEHAVAILDDDPGLGAVGGPNVSPPDQDRWETAVGTAHLSFLVAGWWVFRKVPGARTREVSALPTCNLVVRRADYVDIGGMDEHLFTAEDTDFCTRLVRSGRRIAFSPDVQVFHKDRGLRGFAIQRFTFGVAMVPLLRDGTRPSPAYVTASAALSLFVLFLTTWPVALVSRRWRRLWGAVTGVYGLLLIAEALRLTRGSTSTGRVLIALLVGNTFPGIGALMRLVGAAPDLRGIYRNDR